MLHNKKDELKIANYKIIKWKDEEVREKAHGDIEFLFDELIGEDDRLPDNLPEGVLFGRSNIKNEEELAEIFVQEHYLENLNRLDQFLKKSGLEVKRMDPFLVEPEGGGIKDYLFTFIIFLTPLVIIVLLIWLVIR